MIKILVVEPNKKPYIKEINDELKAFQSVVDGYIQTVALVKNAVLVCNEEGKIKNLQPNRILKRSHICNVKDVKDDKYIDSLCGTFFILGLDDECELDSISEEQIKYWTEEFSKEELCL